MDDLDFFEANFFRFERLKKNYDSERKYWKDFCFFKSNVIFIMFNNKYFFSKFSKMLN